MPEPGQVYDRPTSPDEVAAQLHALGPLMATQEQAETELSPELAERIRQEFQARVSRASPARSGAVPLRATSLPRLGAAVLAIACAVLLVILLRPQPRPSATISAPRPTVADLLFNFPAAASTSGSVSPTSSAAHPAPFQPFAGHLRFAAPRLPSEPTSFSAYRLGSVSGWRRFPDLLQIRAAYHRVTASPWMVAADRKPLHSLAVNLVTGELIYHDRRNFVLPHSDRPLDRRQSVQAARRWLQRLGWPGDVMPLHSFGSVDGLPKVRELRFGWVGAGRTALQEATLWVTPDGSVVEALLWPPISKVGTVPARTAGSAWTEVRQGQAPVAVLSASSLHAATGSARVLATDVVSVLSRGRDRHMYLVPAYRFRGFAHLGGRVHGWLSLAAGEGK